jgi:hypothetical protein
LAQAQSGVYGDETHGDLRATAHVGLPFLVAAVVATENRRPEVARPCRAAFAGVHLVHLRLIRGVLMAGEARDPVVRAALVAGTPNYTLLALQVILSTQGARNRFGEKRTTQWRRAIDGQLLRAYAVASAVGFVRHRRPIPVYGAVAAMLAVGFLARRR